eukprot:TCONS_00062672-protein
MYRANNPNAPSYRSNMNGDSFTHVSYRRNPGYFERVGSSMCGTIFGFILLVVAFPVLFYNEGRAVQTAKSLDEGLKQVNTLSPSNQIFGSNEGKLVHLTDRLKSSKALVDNDFGINIYYIALKRRVEMYQWVEHENKREYNEGDRTRVETSYSYTKEWKEEMMKSSGFSQSTLYRNPGSKPLESQTIRSSLVHVAEFQLSQNLINKVSSFHPYKLTNVPHPFKTVGEFVYKSQDPYNPEVGDLRISFEVAGQSHPSDQSQQDIVSIVAKQRGSSLTSYQTKAGDSLEMLYDGEKSAQEIFEAEHSFNTKLTWGIRFVGWLLMFISFQIITDVLRQIVSFIPIIREIVTLATTIIAFSMASSLTLVTVAIAWFYYRPLLSVTLICMAAIPLFLSRQKAASEKQTSKD